MLLVLVRFLTCCYCQSLVLISLRGSLGPLISALFICVLLQLRVRDEDKLEPPGQKGLIARWVHPFVSANAQKSRRDQSTGARLQNLGGLPSKYWHSVQSRLPPDRRRGDLIHSLTEVPLSIPTD